jgi:hypothetical protein
MHERMPENRNIFIFPTPELSELNERIQWRVKLKERTKGNEQKKKKKEKTILQYNQLSLIQHRHYRLVPGTFRVTNPICFKLPLSTFGCAGAKP